MSKLKIILFSAVIYFTLNNGLLSAENFRWVRSETINILFNSEMTSFISETDVQGNIYTGSINLFRLSYNLDFYGDFSFKKYNTDGLLIYSKMLTGKVVIKEIETDNSGNIYISGSFMDTLRIDSVNYLLNTGSGFSVNYYLLKFDSNGNLIWKKNLNTVYGTDKFLGCINTRSNFIYLGISNFTTGYIKKLDLNGNELLSIAQTPVRIVSSIDADNNGNIFAGGACSSGNILFGDQYNQTLHPYNVYFVKYNSSGNCMWSRFVEDMTFQEVSIACDQNNNLIASGNLFGSFLFGSIQTNGPQWVYDFFITKLDPSGNFLWVYEVPNTDILTGDALNGSNDPLTTDSKGNIFFTGFLRGSLNLGNGVQVVSSGSKDILLLQFDKNGNIFSGKTAGGTGDDRGDCISADNSGNIYISGNFGGTAFFDTVTAYGSGNMNSFLAKIYSGNSTGSVNISMAFQGFYDRNNDRMKMSDTVRAYLRNSFSPYNVTDSSKSVIDSSSLTGSFSFLNASQGNYYLQIKHRNSIETWSSSAVSYTPGKTAVFDFTSSISRSYGSNQIQADDSPLRFALYGGDVNQDGIIDASDLNETDNAASVLKEGYNPEDVTGDNIVDAGDLSITENNAALGIMLIRP